MRLGNLIEGLTILQKYFDDKNGYHIGAEHDQFFVYATNKPVSDKDYQRLMTLGWFQTDRAEGSNKYDPESGWSCWA